MVKWHWHTGWQISTMSLYITQHTTSSSLDVWHCEMTLTHGLTNLHHVTVEYTQHTTSSSLDVWHGEVTLKSTSSSLDFWHDEKTLTMDKTFHIIQVMSYTVKWPHYFRTYSLDVWHVGTLSFTMTFIMIIIPSIKWKAKVQRSMCDGAENIFPTWKGTTWKKLLKSNLSNIFLDFFIII